MKDRAIHEGQSNSQRARQFMKALEIAKHFNLIIVFCIAPAFRPGIIVFYALALVLHFSFQNFKYILK